MHYKNDDITISRRESSAGHPKCQKTISFSDTIDVADDDSPRRWQHLNQTPDERRASPESDNPSEDDEVEGNVDADNIDGGLDIRYENFECRPAGNNTLVVIESADDDRARKSGRYLCGHYDGELDDVAPLPVQHALRQMTVIEEVTSSV